MSTSTIKFEDLPADLQEIIQKRDRDILLSSPYKPEKQDYNAFQWIGEEGSSKTDMSFIIKLNKKYYKVYYSQWINADNQLESDYWEILWEVYPHVIAINTYLSIKDKSIPDDMTLAIRKLGESY